MAKNLIAKQTLKQIQDAVDCYREHYQEYVNLTARLHTDFTNNDNFKNLIHSSKFRTKDPDHLCRKLMRKAKEAKLKGEKFGISKDNVFNEIHDLAGVRFLHIHIKEIELIHPLIIEILKFYKYPLIGKPVAHTWDYETEQRFKKVGFETERRDSMYTSVHYIVKANYTDAYCEIQVRTLTDELWGEVSHKINYPDETDSVSCKEQLLALARIASGCTRLVDSIFTTYDVHKKDTQ